MDLRLFPLVLGAFAIGTETFMVTGVLPTIAADLNVSPSAAGGLVTTFALAYAFGSPIFAVATAGVERKRLLLVAMAAFAVANGLAAFAPSFVWLAGGRVLLALSAGTFMPAAIAYAAASFEPTRRGQAVSLVYAGMTLATVFGVPIGTLIAATASWRMTFGYVGLVSAIAAIGVLVFLPSLPGSTAVSLGDRIAVAKRPDVLKALALTTLTLVGPFAVNTYLGVLLHSALGVGGVGLSAALLLFGVAGFFGNLFGGWGADRWPRERFIGALLLILIPTFALLSVGPLTGGALGGGIVLAALVLWGLFGWAFPSAQQARLVALDPALASITLSLNTSALYIGVAAGSSLGGLAIRAGSVDLLGFVAAATEVLALVWLVASEPALRGRFATQTATACVAPAE
jgi:predicted MFS family arabinose efflux permease